MSLKLLNENHIDNKAWLTKILNSSMWVMLIAITAMSIYRCFYGIEKTDEAYYVADAITALHGNYAFAYNFSHAAGMVFVMIPLIWIYELIVPSLAGVFLYLRICFVLFRLLILIASYFILRKCINKIPLLMGMLFLMPYYYMIQQFSYNTVSQWLTIMTGVLLYGACTCDGRKFKAVLACLAGIAEAFSVFAHPLSAMGTLFFCVMLIIFNHNKKNVLMCFIATGIITAVIILGITGCLAGFDHLIYGIRCYLSSGTNVGRTRQEKWTLLWNRYGRVWIVTIMFLVVTFLCSAIFHAVKHEKKFRQDMANAVPVSLFVLTIYYFKINGFEYYTALYTLGAIFFLVTIVMIPFAREDGLYWFMAFPPIVFCLTEIIMTKNSGPEERMYFVVASFWGLLPLLYNNLGFLKKVVLMLLVLCLTAGQLFINNSYVYRDAPMNELTYAVKSGIFKGIYTTEQNAADIMELESFIHDNTSEDEWIKFMDNVPVGYLFSDGKMCDIRTWDDMNYSYNRNNPTKMYKYFVNREAIPDKLIYVDFGRDEQLSIEDNQWIFNEFVNKFYFFDREEILNETFRIKIYLLKSGVRFEDYLQWVDIKLAE